MDADRGALPGFGFDLDRSCGTRRHQRLVIGHDAELTFRGAGDHDGRSTTPNGRLRRHHIDLKGFRHAPLPPEPSAWQGPSPHSLESQLENHAAAPSNSAALRSTSSRPPTM